MNNNLGKEAEKAKKEKQIRQGCLLGCLSVLGFALLLTIILWAAGAFREEPSKATPEQITLNAAVRFDGTQFIIANNDDFDWTNVKLDVNSATFKSGYVYNARLMEAGQTYTIGAMQFAKSDGTRFNPFTTKPMNMFIYCDSPKGKGHHYGEWK